MKGVNMMYHDTERAIEELIKSYKEKEKEKQEKEQKKGNKLCHQF